MSELKPELWSLDELISNSETMLEDAKFNANKKVNDPKRKRKFKSMYNWCASMNYYLKQLQKLKAK